MKIDKSPQMRYNILRTIQCWKLNIRKKSRHIKYEYIIETFKNDPDESVRETVENKLSNIYAQDHEFSDALAELSIEDLQL